MATFTLGKEENHLLEEVTHLANTKIAERAAYLDDLEDERIDCVIPELLAKHNLLAPTIPPEYGGRGLSMVATSAIIEELAAGCAGAAAMVVMNTYALTPILVNGSDELKRTFLPNLCSDRPHLACMGISETNSDNDLERSEHVREDITRISTTASFNDGNITINGTKDFIMNGGAADFIVLLARSKESNRKSRLQLFVVPTDSPGVEVSKVLNKVGMRSCPTVQMRFTNVSLPVDYSISRRGGGYLLLLQTFDHNMALIGSIGVGIAKGAYEIALNTARTNKILKMNSTDERFVAVTLADMTTKIDAARLTVLRASNYIDMDENYSRVAIMAKLYATQTARQVTSQAVDVVGRLGFAVGKPLEKYMRDAEMLSIVAGSEYLHRNVLVNQL